jgi:hypothetical protein
MLPLPQESAGKLDALETRIRGLREEKARAEQVVKAAKASFEAIPDDDKDGPGGAAAYEAAREAQKASAAITSQLDAAHDEQVALLGKAGGL